MRGRTLLWAITFVVICTAVTTLLKTADRVIFRSSRSAQQTVPMATQFPSTPVQTHTSMKSLPKPAATSAADQHWEAMKLLTEADVAQREGLHQIAIWNGEIESLRSNESGDVVAVNEDLVRKLAYVFGKKIGIGAALLRAPPTPPSKRIRTRRFATWEQTCSRVLQDSPVLVSAGKLP